MIINLVSNALKAGAQTVTLDSHTVSSAAVGGQAVRLSVHDDGPAFPPINSSGCSTASTAWKTAAAATRAAPAWASASRAAS